MKLPDGEYSVMAFNDDTSGVLFGRKGDYDEFAFIVAKVGFTTGLAVLSTGRWARTLQGRVKALKSVPTCCGAAHAAVAICDRTGSM